MMPERRRCHESCDCSDFLPGDTFHVTAQKVNSALGIERAAQEKRVVPKRRHFWVFALLGHTAQGRPQRRPGIEAEGFSVLCLDGIWRPQGRIFGDCYYDTELLFLISEPLIFILFRCSDIVHICIYYCYMISLLFHYIMVSLSLFSLKSILSNTTIAAFALWIHWGVEYLFCHFYFVSWKAMSLL